MTLLARLFSGRDIDASQFNLGLIDEGGKIHAGVKVDQAKALRYITVYACVSIIGDAIASLPIDMFRRRNGDRLPVEPPRWLSTTGMPNPETDLYTFVHRTISSLKLDGNSYWLITGRNQLGYPSEVWNLNPEDVEPERRDGRITYLWKEKERFAKWTPLSPLGEVVHIKDFDAGGDKGLSPIEVARQGIGLGLVTEKFGARFFGAGAHPGGVIESPDRPEAEVLNRWKEEWERRYSGSDKSSRPAVLVGGATWKPISISPEEAQFLETRRFQVAEIARLYRVPPHLVGDVERSTSWGEGIEAQNRNFHQRTLMPTMSKIEQWFTHMVPRGSAVRFNVDALLRADIEKRFQAYAMGRQWGWLSANDIRSLEDQAPIPGGDGYLVPLNMTPAS